MVLKHFQILFIGIFTFMVSMCVPPQGDSNADFVKEKAKLDSLRGI
ncbi:uncharacterized protein METZ01_LOCUS112394, partial [marine metagenome]